MPIENWIQEAEDIAIFRNPGLGLGGDLAKPMLEISPTNRIVTAKGAKLSVAVRMLNHSLGYRQNWLTEIADMVEAYQLTIGDPKNSREGFIEALKARYGYIRPQDKEKQRGVLGI